MIRINLLPYRAARKKENIRKQIGIFFLSLLVVVAILLFYNMRLQKRIDVLNTKITENKAMLAKFENQAKEVDRIKNAFRNLENKTKVIKNLETKRNDAVFLLDNMTKMVSENTLSSSGSDSLPDKDNTPVKRLWFTNFQAKGNNIDIKGIAMDNKTVADFMTRLESSKLYNNVNLKTLKQQKTAKLNLKSFDINCNKVSLNKSESKN
jgi:type IV pilus assembly protein PilN